jgi:hypothetical protein
MRVFWLGYNEISPRLRCARAYLDKGPSWGMFFQTRNTLIPLLDMSIELGNDIIPLISFMIHCAQDLMDHWDNKGYEMKSVALKHVISELADKYPHVTSKDTTLLTQTLIRVGFNEF